MTAPGPTAMAAEARELKRGEGGWGEQRYFRRALNGADKGSFSLLGEKYSENLFVLKFNNKEK